MRVSIVPCLKDNYAYLLHREGSLDAVVVDPSEALPLLAEVRQKGLRLCAILNTHHHHDHVGGNRRLIEELGPIPVYGHTSDRGRIPEQTHFLEDEASFEVGGLKVWALHVPGHTLGALTYCIDGCAFTGDTLFAAGCGRLFEGTPEMMYGSLRRLSRLPESTAVYCGHEYTLRNLEFAALVEPDNHHTLEELSRVRALRAEGSPTMPTNLKREKLTNPFLRCDSPSIKKKLGDKLKTEGTEVDVFRLLREMKNAF